VFGTLDNISSNRRENTIKMTSYLSLPRIIASSSILLTIVGVFVLIGAIYLSRMKRREKESEGKDNNMKSLPNNVSIC
jgi:LPXTG-motif cell wall-anchored protein